MARETFITRNDTNVGVGAFDSIAWAYEVHLKEPDPHDFDSAIIFGTEDSPERIEFYTLESPTITDTPARVWERDPICANCDLRKSEHTEDGHCVENPGESNEHPLETTFESHA
jgi:hypothetical protein